MIPTDEKNELVCDITQISTSHTGIITAMLIRNKLNRFWELTPIILFLKELLVLFLMMKIDRKSIEFII